MASNAAARLKIDDLQVVKNDLWDARTKWKDFGLALLMRKSTLDSIDITQRGDPGDCLREVLSEWLRGAGDPPRTWSTIVAALAEVESLEALAEEVGGKHNVAYKAITRANSAQATPEYQTLIECTSTLITAVKNQLTDLSPQLLQRHLITAEQEREMSNNWHYEADRAAKLVGLVRDKVEQNPKCYHAFIEALEEDQSTNKDILARLKTKYDSLSGGSQKQTTTSPHSQAQVQAEAMSTATTGQKLGIDDLDAVIEVVWEAKEKWFYIGLKLGIKKDKLEVIKQDKPNVDDCFIEVIMNWLSNDEAMYTCTWATMAAALRSPSVRFAPLADKLPK